MDERLVLREIVRYLRNDPVLFFYNFLFPTEPRYLKYPIKAYLHQIDLFSRLQIRRPIRILIGDEIGLGKTIESTVILRYLEERGEVRQILILTPKILVNQWKSELRRLGVKYQSIKEITRGNVRELVKRSSKEEEESTYYIASIDLVKREEHRKVVENLDWDAIVVDEAHNAGYNTQRWHLIKELVCSEKGRERHVILLSATPHRGNVVDYLYRLYLLDPYLSEKEIKKKNLDTRKFYSLTHNSLVYRRTKELVNKIEGKKIFTNCHFYAVAVEPTREEAEFSRILESFLREKVAEVYEEGPSPAGLLAVLIKKRASSSPDAAIKTFTNILEGLSRRKPGEGVLSSYETSFYERAIENVLGLDYGDVEEIEEDFDRIVENLIEKCANILDKADEETIRTLIELANEIKRDDSKLETVVSIVEEFLKKGKKVIIFTEYKDTLNYVKLRFKKLEDKYSKGFFETISGEDKERFEEVKERFEGERCNLLIATDVASEGLNLQVASVVINYEAPWSPVKLEQRIGRVWRIGQKEDVNIYTVFMGTYADVEIMNNLYGKLLAMKEALDEVRPLLGKKVQVAYRATATASEGLWKTKGIEFTEVDIEGKKEKINEFRLILASLKGTLSKYVERLLVVLAHINEELTRKSVYPYVDPGEIKENLKNRIATLSVEEYEKASQEFCKVICKKLGVEARREEICGTRNFQRIWELICGELGLRNEKLSFKSKGLEKELRKKVFFTSAIGLEEVYYFLKVEGRQKEKIIFEEMVLYKKFSNNGKGELVYGVELLKELTKLLKGTIIPLSEDVDLSQFELKFSLGEAARIKRECKERYALAIEKVKKYFEENERFGYRSSGGILEKYCKEVDIIPKIEQPLAILIGIEAEEEEIPAEIKRKIEEAAMEIAMEIERKEGRKPDKSPAERNEHYDIYSYDPRTGEERFIEVKGHAGMQIFGELTQDEFKFGKEKGDKYWLYIVFNLTTAGDVNNAKWIRYRDATRTMNVEVKGEKRYFLFPR